MDAAQAANTQGNDDEVIVSMTNTERTAYRDKMKAIARVRVTEAGFRLARVLKDHIQ